MCRHDGAAWRSSRPGRSFQSSGLLHLLPWFKRIKPAAMPLRQLPNEIARRKGVSVVTAPVLRRHSPVPLRCSRLPMQRPDGCRRTGQIDERRPLLVVLIGYRFRSGGLSVMLCRAPRRWSSSVRFWLTVIRSRRRHGGSTPCVKIPQRLEAHSKDVTRAPIPAQVSAEQV